MTEPFPVKRQDQEAARAPVTSSLSGANTPEEIVRLLASDSSSLAISFDHCSLILPAADGAGVRIHSAAARAAGLETAAKPVASSSADKLLTDLVDEGTANVLGESVLRGETARAFGHDARSVLALPLTSGSSCFGLICFASVEKAAYSLEDAERLAWLADHVAALARAAQLRSQLEIMAEAQLEVARLKSGFINTLLRDIRFPLTSVLGLLELFESKLQAREPFDMEDRQLLGSALENGDRMRRLLDDHLEVAQQQDRPLVLKPEETAVLQLLEDVVEPLRAEAALRGVELNVHVSASHLSMHVDARQTKRALCHLLTVALDATQDGGAIQVEAQTIVGTRIGDEGRRFVVINVADSGKGIPAEEVPFVFDAFWQSSNSRTNSVRGIGLAIAKRVAAAHGGNVSVRSQLGAGTTYSIILPGAQHASEDSQKHRILVVDDVPEILLLLGKLVGRMGHEVEMASCADEALQVLSEQRIDLLLTDWAMPGMNGGELIATLKSDVRWREIPTIVLTGHDTDTERSQARAAGCDRFLVKPVKRDQLQNVISELLTAQAVK